MSWCYWSELAATQPHTGIYSPQATRNRQCCVFLLGLCWLHDEGSQVLQEQSKKILFETHAQVLQHMADSSTYTLRILNSTPCCGFSHGLHLLDGCDCWNASTLEQLH